jgi:hypothetical protein
MLIRCYQQFSRRNTIYHMPELQLMFATSIIRAWKTIPQNILKFQKYCQNSKYNAYDEVPEGHVNDEAAHSSSS